MCGLQPTASSRMGGMVGSMTEETQWNNDEEALGRFDDLMQSMGPTLHNFLNTMMKYSTPQPHWLILFTYGKFVYTYNDFRNQGLDIISAYNAALGICLGDPQIQTLMARFTLTPWSEESTSEVVNDVQGSQLPTLRQGIQVPWLVLEARAEM